VQGKLRNEYVSINIKTECAHCHKPMKVEIDSNLAVKTKDKECMPIAFVPDINLTALKDDSIIDAF